MKKGGFTLIEILLVVAIMGVLAGIVILAVNPPKQLGDSRNAQRKADVNTILNAAYQYFIDTGSLPTTIPVSTCDATTDNEICRTDAISCSGLVNLSVLIESEKYLTSIPMDPLAKVSTSTNSTNGTGYKIGKDSYNRLVVCAPLAEGSAVSVKR